MSFHKTVWQTLSAINCNGQIEKKGNLSYLSWAWAWASLCEHYPASTYRVLEPTVHSDGSYTVNLSLIISDGENSLERNMWLPVMDNRNNAIQSPDARKISDTTMRCLVKAIAMSGLGLYIYAGEDIPTGEAQAAEQPSTKEQAGRIAELVEQTESDWGKLLAYCKVDSVEQLNQAAANRIIKQLESKLK